MLLLKLKVLISKGQSIKRFALACLCEAQDCHPKGDHRFPKGNNQAQSACMGQKIFVKVKILACTI